MIFDNPIALLLFPIYGLVAGFVYLRAKKAGLPIPSRIESLLRLSVAVALSLAAAQPSRLSIDRKASVQALVDISDSIEPEQGNRLYQQLIKLAHEAGLDLEIIPFAKQSASSSVEGANIPSSYQKLRQASEKLNIGGTNLEHALDGIVASETLSQGGRGVLLLSDGWETEGDASALKQSLGTNGVRLFPLVPPDPQKPTQSFRISNLFAPLLAPAQKSVDVRVSIENTSAQAQRGKLEITHDKKVIYTQEVAVDPGKEIVVTTPSDPSAEGIKEISARLTPSEAAFTRSTQTIFLSGEEREKVLLINGTAEDARHLPELLREQAYRLKNITAEGRVESLGSLQDYDAIILNNVALNQLPSGSAEKVSEYVKGGGGLLMIGGNHSFGLGGYMRTAIEDALPVRLVPPQTIEKRLNVAVELIIDKSGSMAENQKLEFAKDAAREVIRTLKNEDLIGVIGFDSAPWIVVKLAPLSEVRESAIDRVGRLYPAQKTNLLPAIDEARRSLVRAEAGRKHMLILTDGKVPDAGPFYIEMTKQMRVLGITVSTIMLGGEADIDMLKEMAEVGGGSFYQTLDSTMLPRIFLSDVKTASGERSMKEQQEFAVRDGPGELKSTTIRSFPPVRGYVQTRIKEGANLELVAVGGDKAEPLLASWTFGKGRSAAFTTDSNGRWSSYWITWEKFARFFTEVVDAIRPSKGAPSERIKFDLRQYVDHGSLILDLTVYSEEAANSATGSLLLPSGTERRLEFESVSRGHFRGVLDNATAGRYELRALAAGKKLTPVAFFLPGELFGEKRDQGFFMPLLSELAGSSGGKINPSAEDLKGNITPRIEKKEITPYVLFLALALLLIHIMWREVWSKRRKVRVRGR